ncbi:MAG TPA: hypothetical protein HPP66_06805 [Planctomycetes bacterium]|nr:hypothetical protein [Planctomycetota bacterium]
MTKNAQKEQKNDQKSALFGHPACLDFPQVFEINGEKLWFIDDVTHVTCMLPSDY